jgi:pimeloyl-ACP methyl ester carboxylesterase
MIEPVPFRFELDPAAVDDLRDRLARTRWPEPEPIDDWSHGAPLAFVQDLCAYWADGFDFDAFAGRLNAHPAFTATVDGLGIHFLHVRSRHGDALPLLLTHGWPGSFVEFLGAVDGLVDPPDPADAFHLVIPSLPGYGFSDRPSEPGWNLERTADAFDDLMAALGYDRYAAQGGDWGAAVTTVLAERRPEHLVGIHVNLAVVALDKVDLAELTPFEQLALADVAEHGRWGSGYSAIQSTRPQTLGYGLTDSPAAQCAWIAEKYWAWTDCGGDPYTALTRDAMLDNISLYWFGATATSSARLYRESFPFPVDRPVTVPSGVSVYPREIFRPSRRWLETRFDDLRFYDTPERGGHFAAFEVPDSFVDQLRRSFRTVR